MKKQVKKTAVLPDILKEDGYHDFMHTFREMESVVEQYHRDLAKGSPSRQEADSHRQRTA